MVIAPVFVVGMLAVGAVVVVALTSRTSHQARAQVQVDDLAVGDLPGVCAITGEPTEQTVQVESSRGGFQTWWLLLLFLGPIGIAAIVLLYALGSRVERVSGIVPISSDALERYTATVRLARRATVGFVAAVVVGFGAVVFLEIDDSRLAVAALVGMVACGLVVFGATIVAPTRWIDLRIDASGRWVTVERAHPAFAAAVRERYLDRAQAPTPGR